MEWQIKTIARNSTLSGEAFKPGDRVVCLVFKGKEAGELGRADLRPDEVEAFGLRKKSSDAGHAWLKIPTMRLLL